MPVTITQAFDVLRGLRAERAKCPFCPGKPWKLDLCPKCAEVRKRCNEIETLVDAHLDYYLFLNNGCKARGGREPELSLP